MTIGKETQSHERWYFSRWRVDDDHVAEMMKRIKKLLLRLRSSLDVHLKQLFILSSNIFKCVSIRLEIILLTDWHKRPFSYITHHPVFFYIEPNDGITRLH